jgi:hypothetical protein
MLHYIIYQSTPTGEVNEEIIDKITHESIKWNSAHGITGILIYHDKQYLQYIEGDEKDIDEVFEMISRDSRHQNITTKVMGYTDERIFPDWSMGSWIVGDNKSGNLKVLEELNHYMVDPVNRQLESRKYIGMMKDILEMWVDQDKDHADKLKSSLGD